MSNTPEKENEFLEVLRTSGEVVHIFLINGIKIVSTIDSFDKNTIITRNGDSTQMLYKSAISTVLPAKFAKKSGTL